MLEYVQGLFAPFSQSNDILNYQSWEFIISDPDEIVEEKNIKPVINKRINRIIDDYVQLNYYHCINPYIHGTTSNILDLLPYTNFSLMGPMEMIELYHVAPVTGQILRDKFDGMSNRYQVCFGRIIGDYHNTYDLEKVINYTRNKNNSDPVNLLQQQINIGPQYYYSNIDIILIYMVRCQELGYDITNIITHEIIANIKYVLNAFSCLLHFGTWLRPFKNLDDDTCNAIYNNFTFEYIKNKSAKFPNLFFLYKENRDIYSILQDIFTLPKTTVIRSEYSDRDKLITLDITQPFIRKSRCNYKSSMGQEYDESSLGPEYYVNLMTQNVPLYNINDMLEKYARNELSVSFWKMFHEKLRVYLDEFNNRIELIETMLTRINIQTITLNKDPYPLIMICENYQLMSSVCDEYRSKCPLKLGSDISIIATDTESNRQSLIAYLETHKLLCKTILFDDLK